MVDKYIKNVYNVWIFWGKEFAIVIVYIGDQG